MASTRGKYSYNVVEYISYITAVFQSSYLSEFEFTKDTPKLILAGKIWGVYLSIFWKIDRNIKAS